MSSTESEQRAAILTEARRWLGTPFHHRQRCLGRGVDCVNLLVAVYSAVGLGPDLKLPWYPHDWHLHRSDELIFETLRIYAHPVTSGVPGDVAVFGYGRCVSHAAIIEDERHVIHAYAPAERVCRTERLTLEARLAGEWTKERPPGARIASYWSVFPDGACAASERVAA